MTDPAVPSWPAVAASAVLVVVAIALAARQRLGLTREIVVAALRAAGQLAAVGAILLAVFTHAGLLGAFGWVVLMVTVAAAVAGRRGHGLPSGYLAAALGVAVATAATLAALLATGVIIPQARVVVPVGGMIVSGAMQATGVALRRLREETETARPAVEARLCLGMPAREAFAPHRRGILRTALQPAVDATNVVGVISLPGAMTGLILAGVDPLTAIRYQIVVMYMLLAATTIAAVVATWTAEKALFDNAHRLAPNCPTRAPGRVSHRLLRR